MKPKPTDLDFPDNNYREHGAVQTATVQAMRNAKGDRRAAAAALGISTTALASRLYVIRNMRNALKDK